LANTAIVLLAAGQSARLGQPKQLLPFGGKALVVLVLEEAIKSDLHPVVVVLGAYAKAINAVLPGNRVEVIHNENWSHGMGTTIATGTQYILQNHPDTDQILFLLSDQPFVSTSHIQKILDKANNSDATIIASHYNDKLSVRALFKRPVFDELLGLNGEKGARNVIRKIKERVAKIEFPIGQYDVDTIEEYIKVLQVWNDKPLE